MVISNHFLYKDLVHHPIGSQPCINRWDPIRFHGRWVHKTVVGEDPNFDYCRVSMGDNATETLQSRMEASDGPGTLVGGSDVVSS